MKKLFLTLMVSIMTCTFAQAQSSLVATLSHEGEATAYYGAEALTNAVAAAQNGDVITLSSGSFNAATINKSITVRGAGMSVSEKGGLPTTITGTMKVNTDNVSIEGLYINQTLLVEGYTNSNLSVVKCRIYDLTYSGGGNAYNNRYIHSKIAHATNTYQNSSVTMVNCVINNLGGAGKFNISNSILLYTGGSNWPSTVRNASIANSIVYCTTNDSKFSDSDVLVSNVGNGDILWANSTLAGNATVEDIFSLFEDFDGTYTDDVTFKLTATGAAYLGADGTQVGIYGGSMPFDPTPTNPQITKAKVAAKSSADGKLSIELEVNGANH
ncbi:MAG: hypothetical protein J5548_15640 [Prevotella sp.]|nr:hypothetical protein [Prevotella sp.]